MNRGYILVFLILLTMAAAASLFCYHLNENRVYLSVSLFIGIFALGFTAWHVYLTNKASRGEAYKRPPLKKVGFLKPMPKYKSDVKHDSRVRFSEMVENDDYIFKKVTLPRKSRVRLAITWNNKEKQSLRHLQVGFKDLERRDLGYRAKPRIVGRVPWWRIKEINPLKPAEYIDLDGYYHIEYPDSRKFGRGSAFIEGFEIETGNSGNYYLNVEIYSAEAKEVCKKILEVAVQ